MNKGLTAILTLFFLIAIYSCEIEKKNDEVSDTGIHQSVELTEGLPDIAGISHRGDSIHLKTILADYILVEFWASWCPPCRQFNPKLVEIYNKHNAKGFEILSISLDHDLAKWQNAIEKDQLPWKYHISDLKGWESYWAQQFEIESIPNNILFDKSGKVIARELDVTTLDVTLERLFKK